MKRPPARKGVVGNKRPVKPVAQPTPVTKPVAPPVVEKLPGVTSDWVRPNFVRGELASFTVRPMTRRNFVGVGAGISAIPSGTDTVLNSFYLTVEPQIDVSNPQYNWKLGLGAPLNFQLVDTRGAFDVCVNEARTARMMGASQDIILASTAGCLTKQQGRVTESFGQLRRADWDEASDFAKLLRYFVVGGQEQPFFLSVGRLHSQSLGHGTVLRDYNPNIDYNTARVGATFDFNRSAIGLQGTANDLVRPDVLGLMTFVRPFRPYSSDVLLRSLSFGFSFVHGVNVPTRLKYEPGLFAPSFDQPIPSVTPEQHLEGAAFSGLNVLGGDVEMKVLRSEQSDLKLYVDYQKIQGHGGGVTLGSLLRLSSGEPPTSAFRARAEVNYFDPDYLPSFFDSFHDIFNLQYLPAGYTASNGLRYYPTKLGFLEANRGGKRRIGGSIGFTEAIFNWITVGASARVWAPTGSPKDASFTGLALPDYGRKCVERGTGDLDCGTATVKLEDKPFASLRLHAELPFRKFLQAFAAYEVFTSSTEGGLGPFKFDGDNEIVFTGARIMLLPILFVQAEARRYFFLQRIRNLNLDAMTVEQDQNYHASWTFAASAYVGYEFD